MENGLAHHDWRPLRQQRTRRLTALADHVVVGEPDKSSGTSPADLEAGSANGANQISQTGLVASLPALSISGTPATKPSNPMRPLYFRIRHRVRCGYNVNGGFHAETFPRIHPRFVSDFCAPGVQRQTSRERHDERRD